MEIKLSIYERLVNALGRVEHKRGEDYMARDRRTVEALRGVLEPELSLLEGEVARLRGVEGAARDLRSHITTDYDGNPQGFWNAKKEQLKRLEAALSATVPLAELRAALGAGCGEMGAAACLEDIGNMRAVMGQQFDVSCIDGKVYVDGQVGTPCKAVTDAIAAARRSTLAEVAEVISTVKHGPNFRMGGTNIVAALAARFGDAWPAPGDAHRDLKPDNVPCPAREPGTGHACCEDNLPSDDPGHHCRDGVHICNQCGRPAWFAPPHPRATHDLAGNPLGEEWRGERFPVCRVCHCWAPTVIPDKPEAWVLHPDGTFTCGEHSRDVAPPGPLATTPPVQPAIPHEHVYNLETLPRQCECGASEPAQDATPPGGQGGGESCPICDMAGGHLPAEPDWSKFVGPCRHGRDPWTRCDICESEHAPACPPAPPKPPGTGEHPEPRDRPLADPDSKVACAKCGHEENRHDSRLDGYGRSCFAYCSCEGFDATPAAPLCPREGHGAATCRECASVHADSLRKRIDDLRGSLDHSDLVKADLQRKLAAHSATLATLAAGLAALAPFVQPPARERMDELIATVRAAAPGGMETDHG